VEEIKRPAIVRNLHSAIVTCDRSQHRRIYAFARDWSTLAHKRGPFFGTTIVIPTGTGATILGISHKEIQ